MKFLAILIKIFTTPVLSKELTEYKLLISIILVFLFWFIAKSAGFIFNKFENMTGGGLLFIIYVIGGSPVFIAYIIAYFRNKTNEVRSKSDLFFLCLSILLLLPTLYILPSLI